ncbi:MAG: TraR/DksA family transcriptional regulator [Bryobacteraceae bacterium]
MAKQTKTSETAQYHKILLDKRESVRAGLGMKVGALTRTERVVAEEDQAQQSHEEFVSLRLNGLDYAQLRQVNEALDRIQAGDYGVCLNCEEEIPAKRLRALPWARYCVPCQEQVADIGHGHVEQPAFAFSAQYE